MPVSAAWAAGALSAESPSVPASVAPARIRLPDLIHTFHGGADTKIAGLSGHVITLG